MVEVYDACSGLKLGSVSSYEELSRDIVGKDKLWLPNADIAHWNAIDIESAKHVRNEKSFTKVTKSLHLVAYSQTGAILQMMNNNRDK